jgi:mitochondrial inner membrane protease subunit SOM1
MAPLVEVFPPSQLTKHIQYHANGSLRKPPVDLKQCALKELLQYECDLKGPREDPRSKIVCEPVLRLFRQYVVPLMLQRT